MVRRWLKRIGWVGLLVALVLVPAKLAQGPSHAYAAGEAGAVPFQGISPVMLVAVGVTAGTLAGAYLRRRRGV